MYVRYDTASLEEEEENVAKYQIFVSGPKVGTSKPFVLAQDGIVREDGVGTETLFIGAEGTTVVRIVARTKPKKFYNADKSEYYEPHAWVEVEIE